MSELTPDEKLAAHLVDYVRWSVNGQAALVEDRVAYALRYMRDLTEPNVNALSHVKWILEGKYDAMVTGMAAADSLDARPGTTDHTLQQEIRHAKSGAAPAGDIKARVTRAVFALKAERPAGSPHYRSGWDDGIDASIDAARTCLEEIADEEGSAGTGGCEGHTISGSELESDAFVPTVDYCDGRCRRGADDEGCEGHVDTDEALTSGNGIGEPTYCDGSCRKETT